MKKNEQRNAPQNSGGWPVRVLFSIGNGAMVKRILLLSAGIVSLVLGILGIFIPLLPTTPFLLLASACFLRSSPALYNWIIRHPIFGEHIHSYQRFHAISFRAKATALVLLWVCILSSLVFVISYLWVIIVILVIAAGVTIYILHIKTLTPEMSSILRQESASAHFLQQREEKGKKA